MRSLPLVVTLAAATLAGCTTPTAAQRAQTKADNQRELASLIGDRVETGTQECIDPTMVNGPTPIGDDTLVYRIGDRLYRNTLVAPCPSLSPTSTVITIIKSGNLCHNDMIRVLNPGQTIPSPYCRLGAFTVYQHQR